MIDDGKNPDEFTRAMLDSCIAKNQITKGKTDAFKVGYRIEKGCVLFETERVLINVYVYNAGAAKASA